MSTSSLRVNGLQYPNGTNANVVVNVKDPIYGALGDGSHDDTAAIQAAITKANALVLAGNSGIYGVGIFSGTMPTVFLPHGVYKLTSALTSASYVHIVGDRSILVASSDANDILTGISFNTTIEGVALRRGRRAVSIATGNVNTTMIIIRDCEFVEQQDAAIYSDTTSNSTLLRVEDCKFSLSSTSSNVVHLNSIDRATMSGCWVSASSTNVFQVDGNGTRLIVRDMVGVPGNNLGAWFNVTSTGGIEAYNCRFGGENGGKKIVENHTAPSLTYPQNPTEVIIKDSECYTSGTLNAFEFYDIPNVVIIEGNHGFLDSKGFYFDAAIPSVTLQNVGGLVQFKTDQNPVLSIPTTTSNGSAFATAASLLSGTKSLGEYITPDRAITYIPYTNTDHGETSAAVTATVTTDTDEWGHGRVNITSTANGGSYTRNFSSWMSAWPTGIYTLVVQIEVVNGPIDVQIAFANSTKYITLNNGKHIVSVPFAWNSSFSQTIGINFGGLQNTAAVNVCDLRLFTGVVDMKTPHTVAYSSTVPVNGGWRVGDRIETVAPTAGGATGFVCTTAGWAVKEAWTTGHVYAIGDQVSNAGNVYVAKTAGTAGASAPTGTAATDISDGTVTWRWVATSGLATFSPLPSVTLTDTQTLTNKTLTSPALNSPTVTTAVTMSYTAQALTSASSLTINPASGPFVRVFMQSNISTLTVSAGTSGQILILEFRQDTTGSRTIPASITNVTTAGGAFTLTTTGNKADTISLVYDSTDSKWRETSRALNL